MNKETNIKYFKNSKLDILKVISIIFFPMFSVVAMFLVYKEYRGNKYEFIMKYIPQYDSSYFLPLIILFVFVYFIIMLFIKYFPILITKSIIFSIKARKRINALLTITLSLIINIFIVYNMHVILNEEKNAIKEFNVKINDLIDNNKYLEAYDSIKEDKTIYNINGYDSIKNDAYFNIVNSIYNEVSNINNNNEMNDNNYFLIYNELVPIYNMILTNDLPQYKLNLYSNKMYSLLFNINDNRTNYFISLYKLTLEKLINNGEYLNAYNYVINTNEYFQDYTIIEETKNNNLKLILDKILEKVSTYNKSEMNDTNYFLIYNELVPIYDIVLDDYLFNNSVYSNKMSDLLLDVNNNRTNYFISVYRSNIRKFINNSEYLEAYNYVKNRSFINDISIGEDIKKEEYKKILDSIFNKCIDINKSEMNDNNYYAIKQNIIPLYYDIVAMDMVKESRELYYTNISDILKTTEYNRINFLRNDFVKKSNNLIGSKDYISLIDLLMKELDNQIYYEMDNDHYNFIYSRILDVYEKYIKEIDKKQREVYNNKFDSYCDKLDNKRHSFLENYMNKIRVMDKKEAESSLADVYHYSKRSYSSKFIFDLSYK